MLDTASAMALTLAFIAGLSTMIGALIIIISGKKSKSNLLLSVSLGFAAGVMLSVAFADLFPEAEEYFSNGCSHSAAIGMSVLFMGVGIAVAGLADKLIPHHCGSDDVHCKEDISRVGFFSMIAIGLHNFPEGVALYVAGAEDMTLGITLAIAVALHNIPGGIAIAAPVYYGTGSKAKAFFYTLIPSLVQPLGALLACFVLNRYMGDFAMGLMFAVVSGFLLFIAIVELFPMSRSTSSKASIWALFAGILLMPLTHLFH